MSLYQKLNTLIKIHKILKPNPLFLSLNLFLCTLHYWLVILKGKYDGVLIDTIINNNSHDQINTIIFYIILYYTVCNLLQKLRDTLNIRLSQYLTDQIQRIMLKTQSTSSLNTKEIQADPLSNSSSDQLIAPFYDVIRLILTSYTMYFISPQLFLIILGLTPIKVFGGSGGLNGFADKSDFDHIVKKEKVVQGNWKLEFGKGLLDKIVQAIVIYFTGVKFINNEINIEELVIFSSQLVTFNELLPAIRADFECLGKSLGLFEKFFEGLEAVDQSGGEQSPEIIRDKSIENIAYMNIWEFKDRIVDFVNKKIAKIMMMLSLKGKKRMSFQQKDLHLSQDASEYEGNEEIDRQEQGYIIEPERDRNIQKQKKLGFIKKIASWMSKRKDL